jgi:NAD(P)-dependent dehydrogenase (short-subunit alcohol dehydrogenase family)
MRELIEFSDQVVLVTGGASGIGREIALEFASEGAAVAIADIDNDRGAALADKIPVDYGVEATFVHTDVSDFERCIESVETVLSDLGRIDVLVNAAAGKIGDRSKLTVPFVEEAPDDWAPQLQVTFQGVLNATRAVLPHMVERGSGNVINVVSEARRGHSSDIAVYGAAKAAVETFTNAVAKEVASEGVRVNAVSPAATWTPATEEWLEREGDDLRENFPLGRIGQPEDTAYASVFLASDAADWITGQTLPINGGWF